MSNESAEIKKLLIELGVIDPTNATVSTMAMMALKGFKLGQIKEAALYHMQTSQFPLKVFDICEYWRKKNGTDDETVKAKLALKAERVFNELIRKANSANDWIVADPRAVVTIKALYVSPQRFSRMEKIADGDDWPRKNFIKRYQEVTKEEIAEAQPLFGGYYANTADPIVTFLGDYNECMQLALVAYEGRKPRLPNSPNVKALPNRDQGALPLKDSQRYLTAITNLLSKAVKKPNGDGVAMEMKND